MNSYKDIGIRVNGKRYAARLYGDRIVCSECNLDIHRFEILEYRVNLFKRTIQIRTDRLTVTADFHKILIQWFDPQWGARYFITVVFMLFPIVGGIILFQWKLLIPSIILAIINGTIMQFFFRSVRENAGGLYPSIITMVILISLPVVYWFPYSGFILVTGLIIFGMLAAVDLIFSRKIQAKKYYLSLAWIIITIYYFLWILAVYKFSLDIQNQRQVKEVFKKTEHGDYVYQNITWNKPLDWKIDEFNPWQLFLNRRSPLWQFSPLPVEYKISTSTEKDFGWITVLPASPENIFSLINQYLVSQKKIFLLELIEASQPKWVPVGKQSALTQSFLYYDMTKRKNVEIHIFSIPVKNSQSRASIVFALALSPGASVNYYLDLIKEGFDKK